MNNWSSQIKAILEVFTITSNDVMNFLYMYYGWRVWSEIFPNNIQCSWMSKHIFFFPWYYLGFHSILVHGVLPSNKQIYTNEKVLISTVWSCSRKCLPQYAYKSSYLQNSRSFESTFNSIQLSGQNFSKFCFPFNTKYILMLTWGKQIIRHIKYHNSLPLNSFESF